MSSIGGSQRRPAALLYGAAVLFAIAVAVVAYIILVTRDEALGERARVAAEKLSAEIERANAYLALHKNDATVEKKIRETTAEVKRRVPRGAIDITLGTYIDRKAKEFHIEDLKWSVQGGIKPPAPPEPANKPPEDRLAVDPSRLQGSSIDVVFTARYKDALKLIRAMSAEEGAAQWPMEISTLEIKRDTTPDKGYKVMVKMTARYLYQ